MLWIVRFGVAATFGAALLLLGGPSADAAEGTSTVEARPIAEPESALRDKAVLEARELFQQGVELAVGGRWQDALSAFERSGRLRPHAVTTYNVGFCERKLGRYTRAAHAFAAALDEGNASELSRLPPVLETAATQGLQEIDSLLATASVTVESADTRVLVDGRPLSPASQRGTRRRTLAGALDPGAPERVPAVDFDVRLDPGTHVFRFFEDGRKEQEIVRTVRAGESLTIVPATAARSPGMPKQESPRARETAPPRAPHTAAYVSLAIGGVGIAAGSTFGILALSARSSLSSECAGSSCPPDRSSDVARLGTYSDLATAGFSVGVAALAVGAILLANSSSAPPQRPSRRSDKASSAFRIVPGLLGARGTF